MGGVLSNGKLQVTPDTVRKVVVGFQNVSRVIGEKKSTGAPLTMEDYITSFKEVLTEEDIKQAVNLFQQYVASLSDKRIATQPPTYMENREPADAAISLITAMSKTVYREDFPSADEIVKDLKIQSPEEQERFKKTYNQIYTNLKAKNIPRKYLIFQLWADLGKYGPWFRGGFVVILLIMFFQIYSSFMWMVRGVRFTISDFFDRVSNWFRPSRYYTAWRFLPGKVRREDPRARRRDRRRRRYNPGSYMVPLSSLVHKARGVWNTGRNRFRSSTTPTVPTVSLRRTRPAPTPIAREDDYSDLSQLSSDSEDLE